MPKTRQGEGFYLNVRHGSGRFQNLESCIAGSRT